MLYAALGPLEIALIVVAVVLVFGVGKLSQVGGALGRSIREFRREKDGLSDDTPKLTTRQTREESNSQSEAKTTEESKN
ncbi:MAG: twin-arginine translocase TatA/TatE family subunit [Chloroflexi bacterium]|nr:MAG: twin-arginine translocase TatA/TatE family subunit [Chloroflexota bacterium]RLC95796.1 MAG: twin-arginine translocase TatA/TatE family subunit [Chloroflexota bacterium]